MSDVHALREKILAAEDLRREAVFVPEWQETLYVRVLTARERDAFETQQLELAADDRTNENIRARLVVLTCVNAEGVRLFGDKDADALGNKASAALERLAKVALRINRVTEADIRELEGKSPADL